MLGLAVALGCGGDAEPGAQAAAPAQVDAKVVARLNGQPLTLDDLRGEMPGMLRGDARHALDAAIARRLVADEARRRGLEANPDVQARLSALRR